MHVDTQVKKKGVHIHRGMATHLLRVRNASQVVLVCSGRESILKGDAMKNLAILEQETSCSNGGGLSIAVDREGKIAAIGLDHDVDSRMDGCTFERCIDASGMSVVPGLVDAHTHPVWVGDRVHEFAMKVRLVLQATPSTHHTPQSR